MRRALQIILSMGLWYELRMLLGFVCECLCVKGRIFMSVCVCVSETDRWTDRNSQKMRRRYRGVCRGREKMEANRSETENEWKSCVTDKQFAKTVISWSSYFNIISVPLLYLCKINYLSGNKWALQDLSLCVFFPITHTITLCQRNFLLLKIIHHVLPV